MKTTVPVLMMAMILSVQAAADSIGSTYDMDKMLSEPHPMANEYGSRWQQPTRMLRPPAPNVPGRQPEKLYRPVMPAPTAAVPSTQPVPGQAPEPPPTTFAPPEPPQVSSTAPPAPTPAPAPAKPPVAATSPPPEMLSPHLSIDVSGIDLEPVSDKAALAVMEKREMEKAQPEAVETMSDKEFEQPGPKPPLPPQ